MTDDESESSWGYRCEGCQTETNNNGVTRRVDKVRENLNTRETAETLAKIHRLKTGHSPEVFGS